MRSGRTVSSPGDIPILKRLEQTKVNLDELDYLAKRLDSFTYGKMAQFQGVAAAGVIGVSYEIKEFINLTFCCQSATVVTDFSDLRAIGQDHCMNLNGGCTCDRMNMGMGGIE